MNVLQHTRNERNPCLKQNRPDRSYRDTLLTGEKICALYIIFIFFLFVESKPSFTATPSDPFYVLEGNNITFVW